MTGQIKRASAEDLQRLAEKLTGPEIGAMKAQVADLGQRVDWLDAGQKALKAEVPEKIKETRDALSFRSARLEERLGKVETRVPALEGSKEALTGALGALKTAHGELKARLQEVAEQALTGSRTAIEKGAALQTQYEAIRQQVAQWRTEMSRAQLQEHSRIEAAVAQGARAIETARLQALASIDASRQALQDQVAEANRRLSQTSVELAGVKKELQALRELVGNG